MHPWFPVIVTICLGVAGLGVQGLLLAYFLGRMKENQAGQEKLVAAFREFTQRAIDQLMDRLSMFDELARESQSDRAALNARLSSIEQKTDGLPRFREEVAGFIKVSEAHHDRQEQEIARLARSAEGMQRQIGELAIHGPGELVRMTRRPGRAKEAEE